MFVGCDKGLFVAETDNILGQLSFTELLVNLPGSVLGITHNPDTCDIYYSYDKNIEKRKKDGTREILHTGDGKYRDTRAKKSTHNIQLILKLFYCQFIFPVNNAIHYPIGFLRSGKRHRPCLF